MFSGILPALQRSVVCHFLAAAFSILVIGWPLVMLLQREEPVTVLDFKIVQPDGYIVPGQQFTIAWTVQINRKGCDGVVQRSIVSSNEIIHSYTAVESFFEDYDLGVYHFERKLVAPEGVVYGKGWYVAQTRWSCNIMQKIFWPIVIVRKIPIVVAY